MGRERLRGKKDNKFDLRLQLLDICYAGKKNKTINKYGKTVTEMAIIEMQIFVMTK